MNTQTTPELLTPAPVALQPVVMPRLLPECEKCGSRNTAHRRSYYWTCRDCKNIWVIGRNPEAGDPIDQSQAA